MKIGASIAGDLNAIATEILQEAEAAVTRGVFAAGRGLRDDWRGQVRASGLGSRLANTVRQADFPRSGTSLRAASLVWTKAPDILHAFDGGVLIRGKDGLWLAIPLPARGAHRSRPPAHHAVAMGTAHWHAPALCLSPKRAESAGCR